ncbi:hypothetical protein D3C72_1973580 [compost metagenome]
MEEVEHQQGLLQTLGGDRADHGVGQQVDQRLDVITADHGAQQLGRPLTRQRPHGEVAMSHGGQEGGLDLGGVIHAGRHAMGQQVQQLLLGFPGGRRLDQLDQVGGLLGRQRQRRNAQGRAFGDVKTIGFEHERPSLVQSRHDRPVGRQNRAWPFPHKG